MKYLSSFLLAGVVTFGAAVGCGEKEPTAFTPARAGERNSTCDGENTCADDLSCISSRCQPVDFSINSTGKACYRVDCAESADCCDGKLTELPAKCDSYASKCNDTIPGCFPGSCSDDSDCGAGTCSPGSCSDDSLDCSIDGDCAANTCDTGTSLCTVSGDDCSTNGDADCSAQTCSTFGRRCACDNPTYDPGDPICSDDECTDELCVFKCEDELCKVDDSCDDDTDCFGNICTAEGNCVECEANTDCDEEDGEACSAEGECTKPCTKDVECGLFETCTTGACVYQGCQSPNECVQLPGLATGGQDPRLATCVEKDDIGVCRMPCEQDAHCPSTTQVCEGGLCEEIGCNSDTECKSQFGAHNDEITDNKSYLTEYLCRDRVEGSEPARP